MDRGIQPTGQCQRLEVVSLAGGHHDPGTTRRLASAVKRQRTILVNCGPSPAADIRARRQPGFPASQTQAIQITEEASRVRLEAGFLECPMQQERPLQPLVRQGTQLGSLIGTEKCVRQGQPVPAAPRCLAIHTHQRPVQHHGGPTTAMTDTEVVAIAFEDMPAQRQPGKPGVVGGEREALRAQGIRQHCSRGTRLAPSVTANDQRTEPQLRFPTLTAHLMNHRFFDTMHKFTRRLCIFITDTAQSTCDQTINENIAKPGAPGALPGSHTNVKRARSHNDLHLAIRRWSLWQPAAGSGDATWLKGHAAGIEVERLATPSLSELSPLKRRRLSPLARVVFQTLGYCSSDAAQEPVVFSSTFGEIQRTQGMLEAIAAGEPVSPTAFSHAVHNAIVGLWSQMRGVSAPMLALAPCDESPIPALLEATGLLAEGHHEAVNVVYAEEHYPEFYHPWASGPPSPTALALQLTRADDPQPALGLSLQPLPPAARGTATRPNAGNLQQLLSGESCSVIFADAGSRWQLERR